jgi:hypothetical protein
MPYHVHVSPFEDFPTFTMTYDSEVILLPNTVYWMNRPWKHPLTTELFGLGCSSKQAAVLVTLIHHPLLPTTHVTESGEIDLFPDDEDPFHIYDDEEGDASVPLHPLS